MRYVKAWIILVLFSACAPYEGALHSSFIESNGEVDLEVPLPDPSEDLMEPAEPPTEPEVIFAINSSLIKLAHGSGQRWDGCSSIAFVQGGYLSNTTCGAGTFLPAFATHLNKDFYQCILDAADAAGLKEPQKVFINHFGTYNNRTIAGSGTLSFHAYARAIDIGEFNLVDKDGKMINISTHITKFKGPTIPFYNEFRQCWKESLAAKGCRPGNREYKGSIGHTKSDMGGNSSHVDHIHMSFPFCAG